MKVVTIVGARPQFIKAAPVAWAVRMHNERAAAGDRIEQRICHTGQHYHETMSARFFAELDIPEPDVNLDIGSGPHGQQTGRMLEAIEDWIAPDPPERVLVYGDTNSTLAGALAAAKLQIPVAHVEAGLRSWDRTMPEETNRVVTDHLSDLLFAPTEAAVRNLHAEGITRGVHPVGDVMYDLARRVGERARGLGTKALGVTPSQFYLATVHRPSNSDDPEKLESILAALGRLSGDVVFPVHPRTRRTLEAHRITVAENIRLCAPFGYLEITDLVMSARLVVTDSGGLQKEAFFHGVPCVTLRDRTEWVETVEAGRNVLAGSDADAIVAAAERLLRGPLPPLADEGPYGDGHAAEAIVRRLLEGR